MTELILTYGCLALLVALVVAMHGAERAERRRRTRDVELAMQESAYRARAARLGLLGTETNRRQETK